MTTKSKASTIFWNVLALPFGCAQCDGNHHPAPEAAFRRTGSRLQDEGDERSIRCRGLDDLCMPLMRLAETSKFSMSSSPRCIGCRGLPLFTRRRAPAGYFLDGRPPHAFACGFILPRLASSSEFLRPSSRSFLSVGALPVSSSQPSSRRHRKHPLIAGSPSLASFRPQVFSTSRRFPPLSALQAYFILLPRPGFLAVRLEAHLPVTGQECPSAGRVPALVVARTPKKRRGRLRARSE